MVVSKRWVVEFEKAPGGAGIKIDYNGIGSGGGIKQIQAKTVTFGATDAPRPSAAPRRGAPPPSTRRHFVGHFPS